MPPARPLRFAVQLVAAPDGAAWASLARKAEDAGFDVVSLPDHLGEQFAPLPVLAAAACATTRIRLSMFVLANDLRHPGMLAKEVATVDVLSGGRVELGLGAGWDRNDYEALGIALDPPSVRIARLEEAVTAIRPLLRGEMVTQHGAYYQLTGLTVRPRPLQEGGVPIVLGGGGRKMLSLAARLGDIVSVSARNDGKSDPAVLGPDNGEPPSKTRSAGSAPQPGSGSTGSSSTCGCGWCRWEWTVRPKPGPWPGDGVHGRRSLGLHGSAGSPRLAAQGPLARRDARRGPEHSRLRRQRGGLGVHPARLRGGTRRSRRIDILVNNAGITRDGVFQKMTNEMWRR